MIELEGVCEKLARENEMLRQDLSEKNSTLLNDYKELESEMDNQTNILSFQ